MPSPVTLLLAVCLAGLLSLPARAETCSASAEFHAVALSGEVAGPRQFATDLGNGWTFVLSPAAHGWDINVLDARGFDLALANPPLHSETNARHLHGWHFRNAANTGPNRGDINAPQRERRFLLGDASDGSIGSAGLGWLSIVDFGLADLDPGDRARMVYLHFNACIMTPKSEDERAREADAASPVYIDEEMELIRTCGLDLAYRPHAWVLPRMLNGDFDGDDAHDFAVPIVREADGQYGMAICRAGTWTSIHGMDDGPPGSDLSPGYFNQIEAWRVGPRETLTRYDGDTGLPAGPGDVITIERIEKSAYSLYWAGAGFRSHHHYTMVEP